MLAEAVAPKHQPHWNEKIIFINGGPWPTNPTHENEIRKKLLFFRELLYTALVPDYVFTT